MEPVHNPSRDFRCIWITVCTYLPPAIWSVERELLLLLSLAPWLLWCQFKCCFGTSRARVLCHGWAAYTVYKQGWFHWVAPIPRSICGGGALVGGCEVAMIFQSTYGVSVTFRVTPTWWVKCMFWRTSPMADRHSSLQEKKITSTLA